MKCPNCGHEISLVKIVQISRWSNLSCPNCEVKLNRSLDLQFALMMAIGLLGITAIMQVSVIASQEVSWITFLVYGIWIVVYTILDAKTVKLKVVLDEDQGVSRN